MLLSVGIDREENAEMGVRYMNHYLFNESKKYNRGAETVESNLDKCEHIIFYETDNGKVPVRDFLMSIPSEELYKETIENIVKLDSQRRNATKPLVDYVDDGIYELRSNTRDGLTRIFYFFIFGDDIVMTNGYIKKTQKMNKDEFKKAKKIRNEFSRNKMKRG